MINADQKYTMRYKELMRQHGMSEEQMAEALGLKLPYYRRISKNAKMPSLSVILETAKMFHTNLSYVLGHSILSDACERYEINNRIEKIRQTRGYSCRYLAKLCDANQHTIRSYELQPQYIGPAPTMIVIAKALEVSIDYMLGLTDKETWDTLPILQIEAGCPGILVMDDAERYFLMGDNKNYIVFSDGQTVSCTDPALKTAAVKRVYREV